MSIAPKNSRPRREDIAVMVPIEGRWPPALCVGERIYPRREDIAVIVPIEGRWPSEYRGESRAQSNVGSLVHNTVESLVNKTPWEVSCVHNTVGIIVHKIPCKKRRGC